MAEKGKRATNQFCLIMGWYRRKQNMRGRDIVADDKISDVPEAEIRAEIRAAKATGQPIVEPAPAEGEQQKGPSVFEEANDAAIAAAEVGEIAREEEETAAQNI